MHKHACSSIFFIIGIAFILSGCLSSSQTTYDYKPPIFVIGGFVLFFTSMFIFNEEKDVSDTKQFSESNSNVIEKSNVVSIKI